MLLIVVSLFTLSKYWWVIRKDWQVVWRARFYYLDDHMRVKRPQAHFQFLILPFLFGILFLTSRCPGADASEKGFVSIFNGKDLSGWEGKPGWWRVEDGAITGESTREKPCLKHNYLIWRGGKPADFELRCRFKLVGGNSGIQFRSR